MEKPDRKVRYGPLGSGVAALIVGLLVWAGAGQPPAGVEAGLAAIFTFLVSYFVPEK